MIISYDKLFFTLYIRLLILLEVGAMAKEYEAYTSGLFIVFFGSVFILLYIPINSNLIYTIYFIYEIIVSPSSIDMRMS